MKVKIIKNSFIILLIAIFLITGFLCLFSCDINYEEDDLLLGAIPTEYQKKEHYNGDSQYTDTEHIERISNLTQQIFFEIEQSDNNTNETIESFTEQPISYNVQLIKCTKCKKSVYFLVEIEFDTIIEYCRCGNHSSKYRHTIGYIDNDNYYLGLRYYCNIKYESPVFYNIQLNSTYSNILSCFKNGKSAYSVTDLIGDKTFGYRSPSFWQVIYNDNKYTCVAKPSCYINDIMECHIENKNHISDDCIVDYVLDDINLEYSNCYRLSVYNIPYIKPNSI